MIVFNNLDNYKFVVWGNGEIGKKLVSIMPKNSIVSIIDSNEKLIGSNYNGVPIISFNNYLSNYRSYYIIIAVQSWTDIVVNLKAKEITKYFNIMECPSQLWSSVKNGFDDFFPKPKNTGNNCIYGDTFFSLLLFWYWKEHGYKNIKLAYDKNHKYCLTQKIICDFNLSQYLMSVNELCKDDTVFYTLSADRQKCKLEGEIKADFIDVFDSSMYLSMHYNAKLKTFKNMHKEKACFIVATGPSLKMCDLNTLHKNNALCFGMNNVFNAINNSSWSPNYYVILDSLLTDEFYDEIYNLVADFKFVGNYVREFWGKTQTENTLIFNYSYDGDHPDENELSKFSYDIDKRIYGGHTVTYACIQIAVYMGFKEIYLLGVDFNYPKGADVKSLHYAKDYYNKDSSVLKTGNKANVNGMLKSYKKAKQVADELGIKIYNATRGGCLEVFERVDFDSLFEK